MTAIFNRVAKLLGDLRRKPASFYLVLFLVFAAGPFGVELVVLLDVMTAVGVDVFFWSLGLYVTGVVSEYWRACWVGVAAFLRQRGFLAPARQGLSRPRLIGCYVGHHACLLWAPFCILSLVSLSLVVLRAGLLPAVQ